MNNISFTTPKLDKLEFAKNGALCLFKFQEKKPLHGVLGLVDWRLHGRLSSLIISDFITGNFKEALLIPLGNRLPQAHLIMLGLGTRAKFNKQRFTDALHSMFDSLKKLKTEPVIIALPSRPEDQCETADAINWFLEFLDQRKYKKEIIIIESQTAQKTMLPIAERWRLKHSVTDPKTE